MKESYGKEDKIKRNLEIGKKKLNKKEKNIGIKEERDKVKKKIRTERKKKQVI